jgi:FkbM family methyltransferase
LRFIDNGQYEQHEIALVKKYLEKNDRVLELGTGLGFVSAYCAKIIGSEQVFSFEGNPELEPQIKKLYSKNKVNPKSYIAMLGEKQGQKSFYVNENSFLASSGTSGREKNIKQVKELNLNDVIATIRPSYLVMDIEGGEYDIFRIIDFQTIRKVQFELHPIALTKEKIDFIFELLSAQNFRQQGDGKSNNNFFFSKDLSL